MVAHPAEDPFDLARFVAAQDADDTYVQALCDLRRGRKLSHWMWFVFPQLAGLGRSPTARRYALASLDEARAYLAHPVLGPRLVTCAEIVASLPSPDPDALLGPLDALKLRSSMTLFHRAAPGEQAFSKVLERSFAGQLDPLTDTLLAQGGHDDADP